MMIRFANLCLAYKRATNRPSKWFILAKLMIQAYILKFELQCNYRFYDMMVDYLDMTNTIYHRRNSDISLVSNDVGLCRASFKHDYEAVQITFKSFTEINTVIIFNEIPDAVHNYDRSVIRVDKAIRQHISKHLSSCIATVVGW